MEILDSKGNKLPELTILSNEATMKEILRELILQNFYFVVGTMMERGHLVIYDEESKSASININGEIKTITHT